MKVVFYIDQLFNGGAERVTSILANEFANYSINDIYVVALNEGIQYKLDARVKYVLVKQTKIKKPWKIIFRLYQTIIELRKIKPDVIYALGYMSQYISVAKMIGGINSKLIYSERTNPQVEPSKKWKAHIRNYLYGKSDVIVCQTHQVEKYYHQRIKTHTCVIPNPIVSGLPKWNGINSYDIICAGRLTKQKNIPLLINSFCIVHKKYSSYKLKIYGRGPLQDELKDMINKLNMSDSISLEGQTEKLHEILSNSFMSVLSSDYEGISNTMIESLGIGIPTICTDCPVGGASMYIKNKINGLLTPVGDKIALAEAMIYYIENQNELLRISNEARLINKTLHQTEIAKKWYELAFN